MVPDETGSGERRQREGCLRQGKGGRAPSLETNTHSHSQGSVPTAEKTNQNRPFCFSPILYMRDGFLFQTTCSHSSWAFLHPVPSRHFYLSPLQSSSSHSSSPHLFLVSTSVSLQSQSGAERRCIIQARSEGRPLMAARLNV